MSALDPELKRLLKWARNAPISKPEEIPFGFSGRVVASRQPARLPTLFEQLQDAAWALSCVALFFIVGGAIVLMSQRSSPPPVEQASSALNFLASNLPR